MSNALYYALQRTAGGLRPGKSDPRYWFRDAAAMVEWARAAGREVTGGRVLEVGTGRMVNIPTALWLCGAAQIVTVDLHRYLSGALVAESQRYVREHEAEVAHLFGAEAERPLFQERLRQLSHYSGDLAGLLRLMNVEYVAPGDAAHLRLPDHSFDYHISYTVLEHIPADIILQILTEARRVLRPGGLLIHFIDPSDHFSHDDPSITAINCLQFSPGEWHKWAGNQFMYHNRLRAHEYLALFEQVGVHLLRQAQMADERSLQALKNGFRLAAEFQGLGPEELAITNLRVMGVFAAQ